MSSTALNLINTKGYPKQALTNYYWKELPLTVPPHPGNFNCSKSAADGWILTEVNGVAPVV